MTRRIYQRICRVWSLGPRHRGWITNTVKELVPVEWRRSSRCKTPDRPVECVEIARLPDGGVLIRNSRRVDDLPVMFTPGEMSSFLQGVKAGEFDDLI